MRPNLVPHPLPSAVLLVPLTGAPRDSSAPSNVQVTSSTGALAVHPQTVHGIPGQPDLNEELWGSPPLVASLASHAGTQETQAISG